MSGYNTKSKNTTLNQLRMLQFFITKQILLNIFHQPLHILTDSINNSTKLLGITKSRSIQAYAGKVSLMLKTGMVEGDLVILKKFRGDLRLYTTIYLGVKIQTNIVLATSCQ